MRHQRSAIGLIAGWLLLGAASAWGQAVDLPAGYREELRLEVVNEAGGAIRASRDAGASWQTVGRVLQPAGRVNRQGYRASAWVAASTVAATAVNALHVTVTTDPATGRGVIFSLVPAGQILGAAEATAALMTDHPPGEGLFGGLGPTVGSPVRLWREAQWVPLPPDWTPQPGDRLLLVRMVPARQLRYLDFENRYGGLITAVYADGTEEELGRVLSPVTGIGRFEGSRYADAGRLRANHAGVLEVSTSPRGLMGAFQIIPWGHANDSEMYYVRTNHQWLVVGPTDLAEGEWAAQPPLFWGAVYPSYRADDLRHADWGQRLLSRAQVLCRRGEGDWEPLPRVAFSPLAPPDSPRPNPGGIWLLHEPAGAYDPLPRTAATVLADVTAFRLCLPQALYWPSAEEVASDGD